MSEYFLHVAKCLFLLSTRIIYNELTLTRLAKLKIGKSLGPDQLHPRILYETRDVIAYPLLGRIVYA